MTHPAGESTGYPVQLDFDRRLKLRDLFAEILRLIDQLRPIPAPA